MKTYLRYLLIIFLSVTSKLIFAQEVYPVVIGTSGLFFGKYNVVNDATRVLPDTISITEAKGIFAFNAIYVVKPNSPQRIDNIQFKMTILEKNGKQTTFSEYAPFLSNTAKERLNKVNSGDRLIFESIEVRFPNRETRSLNLIDFIII